MTPLETLAALSRGDPAAARGLLPAARAQAFGAEAFGPAAIVELFARNPCPLSAAPAAMVRPGAFSAFDADPLGTEQAWFADLHDDLVARVWRVGEGASDAAAEAGPAFAFDPFLQQARDPVAWRAEDHPDMAPQAGPALVAAATAAARGPDAEAPAAQGRAFVLRALSGEAAGGRGAALLATTAAGGAPWRLAAAAFRFADSGLMHLRIVWDAPRARTDTPPPRRRTNCDALNTINGREPTGRSASLHSQSLGA